MQPCIIAHFMCFVNTWKKALQREERSVFGREKMLEKNKKLQKMGVDKKRKKVYGTQGTLIREFVKKCSKGWPQGIEP